MKPTTLHCHCRARLPALSRAHLRCQQHGKVNAADGSAHWQGLGSCEPMAAEHCTFGGLGHLVSVPALQAQGAPTRLLAVSIEAWVTAACRGRRVGGSQARHQRGAWTRARGRVQERTGTLFLLREKAVGRRPSGCQRGRERHALGGARTSMDGHGDSILYGVGLQDSTCARVLGRLVHTRRSIEC